MVIIYGVESGCIYEDWAHSILYRKESDAYDAAKKLVNKRNSEGDEYELSKLGVIKDL